MLINKKISLTIAGAIIINVLITIFYVDISYNMWTAVKSIAITNKIIVFLKVGWNCMLILTNSCLNYYIYGLYMQTDMTDKKVLHFHLASYIIFAALSTVLISFNILSIVYAILGTVSAFLVITQAKKTVAAQEFKLQS